MLIIFVRIQVAICDELRMRALALARALSFLLPNSRESGHKRVACEQLILQHRNLRVNHTVEVQLTAAREREMLHGIAERSTVSMVVSPESIRRTSSARHGSFVSRA